MNITRTISINGWVQVKAALVTAEPTFIGQIARRLLIVNLSATPITVHVNDLGSQPVTAANGVPVGAGVITSAIGNSLPLEGVDLNEVWINTAGAQNVTICVIGV